MSALARIFRQSLARRMLLVQLATSMATYLACSGVILLFVLGYVDRDADRSLDNYAHVMLEARDPSGASNRIVRQALDLHGFMSTDARAVMRFRLQDGSGKVLAQTEDPPLAQPGWRLLRLSDTQGDRSVVAAINEGWLRDIWLRGGVTLAFRFGLAMLLLLPLVVMATVLLTRLGLRPLSSLVEVIGARSPGNLVPLQIEQPLAELHPLVSELNRLIGALEQAQAQERKFFQDAAHELLTPLSAIQAQAHVLSAAESVETRERAKADLHAGLLRAAKMIRQLLMVARIQSTDTQPRLVQNDLADLVANRISAAASRAFEKHIELSLQAPASCMVDCDYDLMTTLIDNLLDNGIKYVPERGNIALTLRRHKDAVWLVVSDDGPGIPEHYRHQVFERFFRVPGNSESGSGLGLAIVQRIAELHGASVELRQRQPQGLMVCLRLAASRRSEATSRATHAADAYEFAPERTCRA